MTGRKDPTNRLLYNKKFGLQSWRNYHQSPSTIIEMYNIYKTNNQLNAIIESRSNNQGGDNK